MIRPLKSVTTGSLVLLLLTAPVLISGTRSSIKEETPAINTTTTLSPAAKSSKQLVHEEAMVIYDSMNLKRFGLSEKAFQFAWQGYKYLLEKGRISNTDVLSICDFSQSSRRKRLYIIDVQEMKVLVNTYVAHGRNSGGEYARSFSNNPESHKSSLGFYITRSTYWGGHGLALNIDGVERGINDKADRRNIVVHGSQYVGSNFLRNNKFNGRSYGCPAVPAKDTDKVINTIKDGSCLFIYHPTKRYLQQSKILNG
ncbi:MAG: murein L,D-transpeptidase catalytic domain family protein [Chitinophagaceae bacterium]|nr:murein L,D-transpeptidase catalytic domain family protein [Chitinophagaceae bacterium]